MKYEIIDHVQRYVKRLGMISDIATEKIAQAEKAAYDFRRISEGHYAVIHGKKMYVIIERDGQIGCACEDMTYNRMDGTICKHVVAFSKLMTAPTREIDELDAAHLMNVCGWSGRELHPEELQIPPDPDLDIGVSDDPPKPEPGMMSANCQYCGKKIIRKLAPDLKRALEGHEATCPKRPKEQEQKPQKEDKKMEENTTEPQTVVQTTEPQRGFLTAAVSLDDAITAFDLYGQAKTRLLSDSDVLYIGANGKPVHKDIEGAVPYIKKSGWRKMARFFGLSVDILGREKIWTQDAKGEKYYIWAYQIKVSHACGAFVHAEGVCSSHDKFFTKSGKVTADETNIMLKAQTVGINRGISDLLGAGEVSAEEME